ncbi:hypothetical protein ACUODJ_11475, partial [Escherichia sp. HC-CC]
TRNRHTARYAWIVVLLIGWMFKRRHDRQLAENQ